MNLRLSYSVKLARAFVALAALARPVVALAAAYALALQVLLASVMAAGMAMTPAADGFVCYGSGNTSDSGNQRPSHAPGFADCALACAQGLSAGAILPPDVSPAPVFAFARQREQAPAADFILSPRPSRKLAQGPPQSA
jgi:hypothetical protein